MKKAAIVLSSFLLTITLPVLVLLFIVQFRLLQPSFFLGHFTEVDVYEQVIAAIDAELEKEIPEDVTLKASDVLTEEWLEEQVTVLLEDAFALAKVPGTQVEDLEGELDLRPLQDLPFDELMLSMAPADADIPEGATLDDLPEEYREQFQEQINDSFMNLFEILPETVPLNILAATLISGKEIDAQMQYYVQHQEWDKDLFKTEDVRAANDELFFVQSYVSSIRIVFWVILVLDLLSLVSIIALSGGGQLALAHIGHALWAPGVSLLVSGLLLQSQRVSALDHIIGRANGDGPTVWMNIGTQVLESIVADIAFPWLFAGGVTLGIALVATITSLILKRREA